MVGDSGFPNQVNLLTLSVQVQDSAAASEFQEFVGRVGFSKSGSVERLDCCLYITLVGPPQAFASLNSTLSIIPNLHNRSVQSLLTAWHPRGVMLVDNLWAVSKNRGYVFHEDAFLQKFNRHRMTEHMGMALDLG